MYEQYFGLRERPFDLLPNPKYLFLAGRHREAFSNLRYGLSGARGITLLIGEAGTGKTTLVQSALVAMDRVNVECVVLSNPTLTRDEFYEFLTVGFNLSPDAVLSKTRFLMEFRRHLESRHADGLLSALVIDEAQSLPYELLEEVRLLSNIESATVKLLNVVLAGQPELGGRLNESRLRQLKQRVALRCELGHLDLSETAAYIAGRLRIAGGTPADIFSREAILAVHDMSRGIPRIINVICDNALIGGFASQVKPVGRSMVEEIGAEFDLRRPPSDIPIQPASNGDNGAHAAPAAARPVPEEPVKPQEPAEMMFGEVPRKRRFSFF
jgi:type II secretory pathway predicted ATPase ExeA